VKASTRMHRLMVYSVIAFAVTATWLTTLAPAEASTPDERLLQPPRAVFTLPSSIVGVPFTVYGTQTSGESHTLSGDTSATYWWSVLPPGMKKPSEATYTIMVMRSSVAAATKSATMDSLAARGCIGNGAGCSSTSPPTVALLGKPGGGWLRGVCAQATYWTWPHEG